MLVSQKQVAAVAGVDRSTVSLALRGHPGIPEATRRKIREVARRMGYRPHPVLSQLAKSRFQADPDQLRERLAFVLAGSKGLGEVDPFLPFIQETAHQMGYGLDVVDADKLGSAKRTADILKARGIRGVIFEQRYAWQASLGLEWRAFAVVHCGLLDRVEWGDLVSINHVAMLNQACERAIERGYRRLGIFMWPPGIYHSDRLFFQAAQGVGAALSKKDVAIMTVLKPKSEAGNPDRALEKLARWKPDVVICLMSKDLELLRGRGWEIPTKIGFVGLINSTDLPKRDRTEFGHLEPLLGQASVQLLDQKLRAFDFSLTERRHTLHLVPPWVAGRTLPVRQ